jgi:hypothetical protein
MPKRSRLLVLLALIAVGLLAGCGNDEKSGAGGGSSGGKSEDPAALLEKAFATDVESGELKLKMNVDVKGSAKMSGPLSLEIGGPFKSRGKRPLLDWDIDVAAQGQNLSGGIVTTEDNAFVKFRGQTYEVGTQLYQRLLRQQEQQGKAGPQTLADLGIDPSDWLEDAKVAKGEPVGGDATRKVSGTVDVAKMVDDVLEAAKSPAIRKQLQGTGKSLPDVSDADKEKIVDAIDEAAFTVNVDEKGVARKATFAVSFDVPEGVDSDGVTGGRLDFEFALPKVGGAVDITAPSDAKPLALLLQQLGLGSSLPGGGLKTQ